MHTHKKKKNTNFHNLKRSFVLLQFASVALMHGLGIRRTLKSINFLIELVSLRRQILLSVKDDMQSGF